MSHQDDILKRYDNLPPAVKDAIFDERNADKIQEFGRKYGLLLDGTGKLAEEVGYFMLGMTHPRDFPSRLKSVLGLPDPKINELVQELNENIFRPIREHLIALHNPEESTVETPGMVRRPTSFAPTPPPQEDKAAPMIFPQGSGVVPPAPQYLTKEKIMPQPTSPSSFSSPVPPPKPSGSFAPSPVAPPVTQQPPAMPKPETLPVAPPPTPQAPTPTTSTSPDPYHEALD